MSIPSSWKFLSTDAAHGARRTRELERTAVHTCADTRARALARRPPATRRLARLSRAYFPGLVRLTRRLARACFPGLAADPVPGPTQCPAHTCACSSRHRRSAEDLVGAPPEARKMDCRHAHQAQAPPPPRLRPRLCVAATPKGGGIPGCHAFPLRYPVLDALRRRSFPVRELDLRSIHSAALHWQVRLPAPPRRHPGAAPEMSRRCVCL
jgi:hypothetical protein